MPRTSLKKRYIGELYSVLRRRLLARFHRTVVDDDDSLEDVKDFALASVIREAESRRYLFRSTVYRKGKDRFSQDLDLCEEDDNIEVEAAALPWLNDEEFLQKYRMSRECFDFVLDQIKGHSVFKKLEGRNGRPQTPVVNQLMVFLKCVGTEGSGANGPNQRNTFEIGKGTSGVFCRRVIKAICSLRDRYLFWPNEQERKVLERLTYEEFGFPHCVGIADGTLFPLSFEPDSEDAPDYSGRKYGYSLTVMIICDLNKKIRYYLAGYPGSAHDNRVYDATSLQKKPEDHFSLMQHIIGDSAFANSPFMVSAFKKGANEDMSYEHEQFNHKLSTLRIRSEHCIGILKGRFPWLRGIRMKVTDQKSSVRRIVRMIDATVILHNMLTEFGEEENTAWIDEKDFSDLADGDRAPYEDGDELNSPIPGWAPKDERRQQLLRYFKERFFLAV